MSVGIAIGSKLQIERIDDSSKIIIINVNDSLMELDQSLANNVFVNVL